MDVIFDPNRQGAPAAPDAAGIIKDGDQKTFMQDVVNASREVPILVDFWATWCGPCKTLTPALEKVVRAAGGRVRLRNEVVDPDALPAAAGRTAYRVVQEGLTNARKHATGRPVQVMLEGRPGARLVIDIRNPLPEDGAATSITPGTGTGLVGLTERVQLAGGRLDHEVTAGEFRLRAWLPWPA